MRVSVLWEFFFTPSTQTGVHGTGAATFNRLTASGTGASHHVFTATGAASLTHPTVTQGTGRQHIFGSGAVTLNRLTAVGVGHASHSATGTGAASLNRLTAHGTGTLPGAVPDDDPLDLVLGSPLLLPKVTGRGKAEFNWLDVVSGQGRIIPAAYIDGPAPAPTKLVMSGRGAVKFGSMRVAESEAVWMDDMEDLLTLLETVP